MWKNLEFCKKLSPGLIVIGLFALVFVSLEFRAWLHFSNDFPGSYVWSELLINYQGGVVRRGLLGEIAFELDRVVPAKLFFSVIVCTLYALTALWIANRVRRINNYFIAGFFLLSPRLLLFPLYDSNAFGRKDIFILAAFCASLSVIDRLPRILVLPVLMVIYLASSLVVETSILYFPMAVAVFIYRRSSAAGGGGGGGVGPPPTMG
jgi:hypothetical protein